MPEALEIRAQELASNENNALGTTAVYPLPGVTALIQVEPRTWKRENGVLLQGCFRVGGIYLPTETITPPVHAPDKLSKTVGILTVVSLVISIGASLVAWGNKK